MQDLQARSRAGAGLIKLGLRGEEILAQTVGEIHDLRAPFGVAQDVADLDGRLTEARFHTG